MAQLIGYANLSGESIVASGTRECPGACFETLNLQA